MASSSSEEKPSPNGTSYLLPATAAQGLANYPHARVLPGQPRVIYVSGTSSRRGDGTYAGCRVVESSPSSSSPGSESEPESYTLDVREQTAAVLQNIGTILRGATGGAVGLEAVVDATVFLTDMARDYAGMNDEWNRVWPDKAAAPARTCVQVAALPSPKLNVEIKCMALWP